MMTDKLTVDVELYEAVLAYLRQINVQFSTDPSSIRWAIEDREIAVDPQDLEDFSFTGLGAVDFYKSLVRPLVYGDMPLHSKVKLTSPQKEGDTLTLLDVLEVSGEDKCLIQVDCPDGTESVILAPKSQMGEEHEL